VRELIKTSRFKRDYKKIAMSGRYLKQDFLAVVDLLIHDKPLPEKYRDHSLVDDKEWKGCRECHIKPDWLLIYKKLDNQLVLVRTGSHSELFI
jgi:mRNA interferase YafQ